MSFIDFSSSFGSTSRTNSLLLIGSDFFQSQRSKPSFGSTPGAKRSRYGRGGSYESCGSMVQEEEERTLRLPRVDLADRWW
jgi:hypothetical protein